MLEQRVDAVVIGAGIIGCGIAWELSKSGRKVTIVDMGRGAGTGSTGASSANVRFHYSTRDAVALSWEAKHGWENWGEHLGDDDPDGMARFVQTGTLVLDIPGASVERTLKLLSEVGVPHSKLTPSDIGERFPYLDSGQYFPPKQTSDPSWADPARGSLGAILTPQGGFIDDPSLAARNVFHAATRQGAQAKFGCRVRHIVRAGDQVRGVALDSGEKIGADCVVNAAGPHSNVVNELAGVLGDFRISCRPLRVEVHSLPPVAGFSLAEGAPCVSDQDLGTYFRPELGGGVLVGGGHPQCDEREWLDDLDSFKSGVSLSAYETQTLRFARRVPSARIPFKPTGIAGVYDVSEDWMPIYDRTSLRGFYVAVGTSGNQFKNGPVVGALVRRIIEDCEEGVDHDASPQDWSLPYTGQKVNLGHYSRLRLPSRDSSRSVVG